MNNPDQLMQLPAIDLHGHCGEIQLSGLTARMVGASAATIVERATACAIQLTCVSDLGAFSPPQGAYGPDSQVLGPADVAAANQNALTFSEQFPQLRFYAVLNPKNPGWEDQTSRLLQHPGCAGVKLHPRWNYWEVEEYGERVFAFLHEHRALTLTHTGNAGNEPERFIPFAERFGQVRLILAHIGHDETGNTRNRQVLAVEAARSENVWADTSSARSILSGLIEYAVGRIGSRRIVFGTDTPLYSAAAQKARIAFAEISLADKQRILYGNAAELLGL